MKINSTSPTPVSRVREILEKRSKNGEELGYEQENALEHSAEVCELDSKKAASLASKLMKEVPGLTDETALKLAEICPSEPALVKAIALYSQLELSDEDVDKILKTIKG